MGFNPNLNKQLRTGCELRRADLELRRAVKDAIAAGVPVTLKYQGKPCDLAELEIIVGAIMARAG